MAASFRLARHVPIWAPVLLLLAFAVTLLLRMDMLMEKTAAQGVEATYHVLWTSKALSASDPAAHAWLPTVTLSPDPAQPIPWGATVPTAGGAFVYTSFPPLGFLLPAIALKAVGADSFLMLGFMNCFVGLVAALALAGLARDMVLHQEAAQDSTEPETRERDGWIVFTLCAISYLFLREALVSHGAVVWAHSLSQLCLIVGCWLAFRVFTRRGSVATVAGLVFVALLYPSLEWTGFVFNAGLVLALLYNGIWRQRKALALSAAVGVVLATLGAVALFFIHFASAVGPEPLLEALRSRADLRNFSNRALLGLPLGYFVSFGALLPLTALAVWWLVTSTRGQSPSFWLLIFVASFPLLENGAMMQHAYQFSFDRLKLAVPLLLICAMAVWQAWMPKRSPLALLGLVAALIASNLLLFGYDTVYYKSWGSIHASNASLVEQLTQDSLLECGTIGSNGAVRGYMNLSFGRDIHEHITEEDLVKKMVSDAECGAVFVRTAPSPFRDLPRFRAIDVYDRDGALLRGYEPA